MRTDHTLHLPKRTTQWAGAAVVVSSPNRGWRPARRRGCRKRFSALSRLLDAHSRRLGIRQYCGLKYPTRPATGWAQETAERDAAVLADLQRLVQPLHAVIPSPRCDGPARMGAGIRPRGIESRSRHGREHPRSWHSMGQPVLPKAHRLLITADSGGSAGGWGMLHACRLSTVKTLRN